MSILFPHLPEAMIHPARTAALLALVVASTAAAQTPQGVRRTPADPAADLYRVHPGPTAPRALLVLLPG